MQKVTSKVNLSEVFSTFLGPALGNILRVVSIATDGV